jgi:hypothetical protein
MGPQLCLTIRKLHLCACARLIPRSLGNIGFEIAVFPGTISIARGPQHCSIIRKLHLCTCPRLSLGSLGKIGSEIAVFSWNHFYSQGTRTLFRNQETAPLRIRQTELLLSLQELLKSQCFPGTISTVRGPQHCSIIRKLHLYACARLSSRSLGKLGAEIAVLFWNNFYCQGTRALFHNQETAPLRMRQTDLSPSWQYRF